MDAYEATKVVFARVQALDPDLASKIVGTLLVQDHCDKDMIRLAFGPEHLLHSVVAKARADLACKAPTSSSSPPAPSSWGGPFAGGDHVGYDGGGGEALYPEEYGCWSPASGGHRRSFSLSDAEAGAATAGGWKPCLYFARGFCKNGSSCRFLHGLPDDAEQEMVVLRAKAAAARSQMMAPAAFPFSPSPKGLNFLLHHHHQQQSESQRAAAMLLGGEDMHNFSARSPRMDRGDVASSVARQIYLTFPADSTFTEEDVSNYFSIYGPVQDVRIPHQPKRMFGFVSFVYPETVRIILAKGNPHFVCDARVLVKPYKEKGKVPDRFRNSPHQHHRDFAGLTTLTGLLDSRDPFDLQQPQIGPRMMYGNIASHEASFLRRKIEEQHEAAELQQAIELQSRRFMGLQLHDLNNRGHHLSSAVGSPVSVGQAGGNGGVYGNGNAVHLEDATIQDNKLNSGLAMSAAASAAAISAIAAEGKREQQQEEEGKSGNDGTPKQAVNSGEEGKRESGPGAASPNVVCGFQGSGVEHNLPDSPFASPTKAFIDAAAAAPTPHTGNISNSSPHVVASSLFPPTSTLELPPYNTCFFQVPRFSPGRGAIGL